MGVSKSPNLLQEPTMNSYITQAIARQQIDELIAHAERSRVRRQFRQARRADRIARRRERASLRGPSNSSLSVPNRIGIVGVR
jgi:hypothetical protein